MKRNQFTLLAVTFISGIVLGISTIALFSFTNSSPVSASISGSSKIGVPEANALFKNYFNSAAPSNAVFKGFAINKDQLSAINSLSAENPGLAGFRVYMGKDITSGNVGIVVGVNESGLDVNTSI